MAEATFEQPRRHLRARRDVPVPGYPLAPENGPEDGWAQRPSSFWRVVAALVQALLCVLVVLAALSTVVDP